MVNVKVIWPENGPGERLILNKQRIARTGGNRVSGREPQINTDGGKVKEQETKNWAAKILAQEATEGTEVEKAPFKPRMRTDE